VLSEVNNKDLISTIQWKRPVASEVKIKDLTSTKLWKRDQWFQK
jgi:hypothetical protein